MANEFVARNGIIALNNSQITGSLNVSNGITGSLFGTASLALQNIVTASVSNTTITFTKGDGTTFNVTVSQSGSVATASYAVTSETASYVNPLRQKVIISGSIDFSPSIDPDPTGANTTDTFLFVSSSNTALGNDLYIRQDGNLVKWKWIEGQLASGILYGGTLSYSGSNLYVKSGSALIVNDQATTGSEPSPLITYLKWNDVTQSLAYLTSSTQTYVYIDSTGTVRQQTGFFTPDQYQGSIPIGLVYHSNKTTATAVGYNVYTSYNTINQALDFITSFGPLKQTGCTLSGTAGTLQVNVSAGYTFILGGFYGDDPNGVSHKAASGAVTASIVRYYRTGSSFIADNNSNNFYTVIDPTKYDDGTGALPSVPGGSYTIQRVFYNPRTNRAAIYYGQTTYSTLANALAQVGSDPFTEAELTAHNNVFVGYIVVKSNATDLTDAADAAIVQSGLFRNTVGSAGSTSFTPALDDLTDVTITSATNGQALIYNGGTWVNGTPVSASYALSSSYARTSSIAVSSSYATTASYYGGSVISASYAYTASYLTPLIQNVTLTGSLLMSGSVLFNVSGGILTTNSTLQLTPESGYFNLKRVASSGVAGFKIANVGTSDSAFWRSNNANGDVEFGNPLNYGIQFYTNDTAIGKIFNTGNWFVGTSPTDGGFKLDVAGSTRITGQTTIDATGTTFLIKRSGATDFGYDSSTFTTTVFQLASQNFNTYSSNTSRFSSGVLQFTNAAYIQGVTQPVKILRSTPSGGGTNIGLEVDDDGTTMDNNYKPISIKIASVEKVYMNSSGSMYFSNGATITGSLIAPSITGSLQGTSSWANNSISSSYATLATTASYFSGSISTAISSSYAATASIATSASYALSAQTLLGSVVSASYAATASYVVTAQTASYVTTSSWSQNAITASYVSTLRAANSNSYIQYNSASLLKGTSSFTFTENDGSGFSRLDLGGYFSISSIVSYPLQVTSAGNETIGLGSSVNDGEGGMYAASNDAVIAGFNSINNN